MPDEIRFDLWPSDFELTDAGKLGDLQNPSADPPDFRPYLRWLPCGKANAAAVLIIPGGGYSGRADMKGDRVGAWLNTIGYHAAVLRYRKSPWLHPAPQHDALRALRLLRSRSGELGLDPHRICLLGGSAGGHLAASATLFHKTIPPILKDEVDTYPARPELLALIYPVISMIDRFHYGSLHHHLGPNATWGDRVLNSLERQVGPDTPPTYLVHCTDDQTVPVANSYAFAAALFEAGVPHELHALPEGGHGWEFLADKEPWFRFFQESFRFWLNERTRP